MTTLERLTARLEDARNESASCGDDYCGCHLVPGEIEDAIEDAQFHDECSFAWSVHNNAVVGAVLPFGCPTEGIARARWGR